MSYRSIIVVDDFYDNPDEVRELALSTKYSTTKSKHFTRSSSFFTDDFKKIFEDILKIKIKDDSNWGQKRRVEENVVFEGSQFNGTFYKYSPKLKTLPNHIHHDSYDYVATVMLSPECPSECGTSFWEEITTQKSFTSTLYSRGNPSDPIIKSIDPSLWRKTDEIEYKYNRLLLYSGRLFHSINMTTEHERINQLFCFNKES